MLRVTVSRAPEPRAVCFDLESRPSAFWYGDKTTAEITAIGWKWADEHDVHTLILLPGGRFVNDKGGKRQKPHALLTFVQVLQSAGLVYGHNIRQFDLKLFQAALMRERLPLLPPMRTTDTLRDLPKRHDMAASLDDLVDLYDLATDRAQEKKHMSRVKWERANQLQPGGIEDARERVTGDVLLQEQLRTRLRELGYLRRPRVWNP